MVKRVFITSDLGENALPKWASWVKVVIDGKLKSCNIYSPLKTRHYSRGSSPECIPRNPPVKQIYETIEIHHRKTHDPTVLKDFGG